MRVGQRYFILVFIPVLIFYWIHPQLRRRRILASVILSYVFAVFLSLVIRFLVKRPRPFMENEVNLLIEALPSYALPSLHAVVLFVISASIFYYNKKVGIILFIIAGVNSLARIFIGVHYPLDVLSGALIGILSVFLINKVFKL